MEKEIIDFKDIISMIETRRNNAYRKVNEELIMLYWDFGKYVSEKLNNYSWGKKLLIHFLILLKKNTQI